MAFGWIKNWLAGPRSDAPRPLPEPQDVPDLDELAELIKHGDPSDPAVFEKIAFGLGQSKPEPF